MELTRLNDAQECDHILNYIQQSQLGGIDINEVRKNTLSHPLRIEYGESYFAKLYSTIVLRDPPLVHEYIIGSITYVKILPYGRGFLYDGGFTEEFKIQESVNQKVEERRNLEDSTREFEFKKMRYEAKLVEWKYRTYWIVAIAGVIGFLLSIYNAFWKK